ncbi:hypothetical protein [Cyclobacterium qasimii]|uniref:Uncharacterized protein n=2 Tax=Cyclobacterium qasimii TaxID=1350429 RepID=S7V8T5_9BACT|nr:hypothetical protein [Cyclobacterium qasimii]EPR66002.1 hypothetical protein ADICYQ_4991 [Cyclobacterium qasimii M12-11B]GEO20031.1 hypothetical protein CQA01_05650 [Cyclobacterium qasimii]
MKDKTIFHKLSELHKKESRYWVLECAVFMEEQASDTLGAILGIDWKKSESLGYGSASLGFGNKIRLITDLKEVSKEDKKKFQSFMTIRNKFAHIAEIDSFSNYFKLIKSSQDQKNKLKKWYPNIKYESDDIEGVFKLAYWSLTLDLFQVFIEINQKHFINVGIEKGQKETLETFFKIVKDQLKDTEEGCQILEKIFGKILNKTKSKN